VIIEIRTDEAALNGGIPCGSGLKRDEDPIADTRVGELHPKGWVIVVAGGQHASCRRDIVGGELSDSQICHRGVLSVTLTMRRIAAQAGCSTTVLHTMFGGKAGIAEALWREGFGRLGTALDTATGDHPLERLGAMARAYRANALANRPYYAIMFQRPIAGFEPSREAYEVSLVPLRTLADAVADCIRDGVFRTEDPDYIASVLWAATHGAVSLELAGYEGAVDAARRFETCPQPLRPGS
jgi:AcrR family transcriptional regulator